MERRKKLSLLVLCHEFPPLGGGAGIMASLLCGELHRRGEQVEVWINRPPVHLRESFPYPVHYFPSPRKAKFSTHFPAMLTYILNVIWRGIVLRKENRNTFILSVMAIPAGISGAALSFLWGMPHGIWHHGSDVHAGSQKGPGFLQSLILKTLWARTEYNFFVSQGLMNIARSVGAVPHTEILPNGIDFPEMESKYQSDPLIFLFAARLDEVKNPMLFLEGIKRYNKMDLKQTVEFKIVGSGKLHSQILEICEREDLENVTVQPAVGRQEMPLLYRNAFALIMTSKMEGFPLNVLEAGRCGVPTIGADTSGLNEIIEDNTTGLLFKKENPQALADAMARLASDPNLRNAMGKRAREKSLFFSCEKMGDIFLELVDGGRVQ